MDQMTKQTETSVIRPENSKARRIVGVVFGIIQIVLGMRLVFTLLGANPENVFIRGIRYSTQFIVGIFEGIFPKVTLDEVSAGVFDPATLIAMVVVALIGWAVFKLMTPNNGNRVQRTESMRTATSGEQREEPNKQSKK